jgi:hypothetical protein
MPQEDQVIRSRHKNRGGAGTALYWGYITAKVDDSTYTGDIYLDRGDTGEVGPIFSAVTIRVHDLAAGETIANQTFLPVAQEPWTEDLGDGYETNSHWTVKQQIGLF